jgi:glycolate oxidase iron-sulfur subunit
VKLHVDDDELAACVSCGLCLPHCPTWRVTGEEARSPRGRITAMRDVHLAGAPPDDDFVASMDTCVQCRGCEPACPSGVPFGRLMAGTRETLAETTAYQPRTRRWALRILDHHGALVALSRLAAIGQRLHLVPTRLGLPRLPLRQPRLASTGDDVWLFTGCVMDAWQREVHVAAARVLGAAGVTVAISGSSGACCGALAEHAGLRDQAVASARRVVRALPGDAPILVDSAGCGAMLKDYGRLLGTPEAAAFAARVVDIHEWLARHLDRLPPLARLPYRVAVQDPCHLRHVQHAHGAVREVLAPVADLVELDDEGLCCGAGGAFSIQHPELAGAIRERKVEAIVRSGAPVVASANPGCALHLAAAGLTVRHPVELLAEALGGARADAGGEHALERR